MLDYKLVEAAAAVIREGGFDKAARVLNLTQSAVSQRVKALEDMLGKALIVRSLPVRPTPEGQRIVRHFLAVSQLESDLTGALTPVPERGWTSLPVGVNADSLGIWFLEAVSPLLTEERVLLDIEVDDQERTHRMLREGEVAGCVSTRPEAIQGCRCVYLGRMDYLCLATPAFAARWFPAGLTAEAVAEAPAVMYNRRDEVHHAFLRDLLGREPRVPTHFVPHTQRFVDMIAGGWAYGMVDMLQAAPYLADGRLIPLAPEHPVQVRLHWHYWSLRTRLMDRLTDCLAAHARRVLYD